MIILSLKGDFIITFPELDILKSISYIQTYEMYMQVNFNYFIIH